MFAAEHDNPNPYTVKKTLRFRMNIQIHLEIDPDLSGFMSISNFWIYFQFKLDFLFVLLKGNVSKSIWF